MPRMQDKVAMVTGGGQGLGEAICKRLASEGALIAVAEVNVETGKQTADAINASGGTAQFFEGAARGRRAGAAARPAAALS